MKTCKTCGVEKTEDQFHTYVNTRNGKEGLRGDCKFCAVKKARDKRQADPEKYRLRQKAKYQKMTEKGDIQKYHRERHLVKTYGMTVADWEEMFDSQGRSCLICKSNETKGSWCVDHNHNTEEVRGILCQSCNSMICWARDHPQVLLDAKKYLDEAGYYGEYQPSLL